MASVRQVVLAQVKTTLDKLLTTANPPGKFKRVYTEPQALDLTPEHPAVWFSPGIPTRDEYVGIPGNDEEIEDSVVIGILASGDNETIAKDLEDLIEDVRAQVKTDIADFRGLSPSVYVTSIGKSNDPQIDFMRDFAHALLALRYHN